MNMQIPNSGEIGRDVCNDAQLLNVPIVIFDNGDAVFWYCETMDYSAANRMVRTLTSGGNMAYRLDVPLVLPPPALLSEATERLDQVFCEPHRLLLQVDEDRRLQNMP